MYCRLILIIICLTGLNACLYKTDSQIIGSKTAAFPLDIEAKYYDASRLSQELERLKRSRDKKFIGRKQEQRLKKYLNQALLGNSRRHRLERQGHCYKSDNYFAAFEEIDAKTYLVSLSKDHCGSLKQSGNYHIAIVKIDSNVVYQLNNKDLDIAVWAKQKTGLERFFLNIKWQDKSKTTLNFGGKRGVKQFYQTLKKQAKLSWKPLYISTPLSPGQQRASDRLRDLKTDIKKKKRQLKQRRQKKSEADKKQQRIQALGLVEKTPGRPAKIDNLYLVYGNGNITTLQTGRAENQLKEMLVYPFSGRNGRMARVAYNADRIQIEDTVRGRRKANIIKQDRAYRSCPYLYDTAINYQLYPIKEAQSQWYYPNRWRLAQISAACKIPRFNRDANLHPCRASCKQWHNGYKSSRDGILLFRYLKDAKRFAQRQGR